ncbi:MAG: hypothetical protein IBJ00_00195 [Alphaproteobacteria bacterium]|nr:hypothetical protein [Alphaproteobacteria bacterium]
MSKSAAHNENQYFYHKRTDTMSLQIRKVGLPRHIDMISYCILLSKIGKRNF